MEIPGADPLFEDGSPRRKAPAPRRALPNRRLLDPEGRYPPGQAVKQRGDCWTCPVRQTLATTALGRAVGPQRRVGKTEGAWPGRLRCIAACACMLSRMGHGPAGCSAAAGAIAVRALTSVNSYGLAPVL